MKLNDFCIGNDFICNDKVWNCTDVGTRVIAAICISDYDSDPTWCNGPPYAVAETVFDEDDQLSCKICLKQRQ